VAKGRKNLKGKAKRRSQARLFAGGMLTPKLGLAAMQQAKNAMH
jgi:hypothetical protein